MLVFVAMFVKVYGIWERLETGKGWEQRSLSLISRRGRSICRVITENDNLSYNMNIYWKCRQCPKEQTNNLVPQTENILMDIRIPSRI